MRGVLDTMNYFGTSTELVSHLGVRFINMVKDAMPRVADPENAYWIYQGDWPSFRSVMVGTIHPNYLLVVITCLFVFAVLYIKLKYPFWNQIPALHKYDWHRRFIYSETPYLVHLIPKKTKYYEPTSVCTRRFSDMEFDDKMDIVRLLQTSYLPSDRVFCSIQLNDIEAQWRGAVVSYFTTPLLCVDQSVSKEPNQTRSWTIDGVVSSRKIQFAMSITDPTTDKCTVVHEFGTNMDYLCFRRKPASSSPSSHSQLMMSKYRKLFHTHEYNSRHVWPDRNCMLFKKEVELCDAIVPLVEYESRTFYMRHQILPAKLPHTFQIARIQKENLQHLHDWMQRIASLESDLGFCVSITAEIGDLIHLLQTNQMYAYALTGPDKETGTRLDTVYALYFFRNAHMKYEDLDGGDTLHSIAAFCNTNDAELYFTGYLWAVKEARKHLSGESTKMIMIDDIGHLRGVVKRWTATHDVILNTKCAYYFCNYILPRSPYRADLVNILL